MDIAFAHTLHIAMTEGATGRPTSADTDQDVTPKTCICTTHRHILDTPASEGFIFLVLYFLIIMVDVFHVLITHGTVDIPRVHEGLYNRGLQDDVVGGYTYVIG